MWDDEIDNVARLLTSRRVPTDLRARTVAHIDGRHTRQRRAMPFALTTAVAVLALSLLVAFFVDRHTQKGAPVRIGVNVPSTATQVQPRSADVTTVVETVSGGVAAAAVPVRRVGNQAAAEASQQNRAFGSSDDAIAIVAMSLPSIAPDQPVVTAPIATDPLTLEALEIPPVDIQALNQPLEGVRP